MTETINDVEKAKAWLLGQENLGQAMQAFDQKYGEGSSIGVIRNTYKVPEAAPVEVAAPVADPQVTATDEPTEEPDGWLRDMGKALVEGPVAAFRETMQAVNQTAGQNLNPSDPAHYGLDRTDEQAAVYEPIEARREIAANTINESLDGVTVFGSERDTIAGALTQGMAQALSGMLLTGGKSALTTMGGGITSSFAAGVVAFDPDEANFVRTLDEQFDISSDFTTELLANDSDSEAINRFQNGITDGILGVVGEGAVQTAILTFRALRGMRKARVEVLENGSLTPETMDELTVIQAEIKDVTDLAVKPKGKPVEGRFVTNEGLAFDLTTGARDLEFEATLPSKVEPVNVSETPAMPDAPEFNADGPAPVRSPEPSADVSAPESLTPPTVTDEQVKLSNAWDARNNTATTSLKDIEVVPAKPDAPKIDGVPKAPEAAAPVRVSLYADELKPQKIDDISGAPKTAADGELPAIKFNEPPVAPEVGVAIKSGKTYQKKLQPLQAKTLAKIIEDLKANPDNIAKIDAELSEKMVIPDKYFENGYQIEAVLKATAFQLQKSGMVKKITDVQLQAGVMENAAQRLGSEVGLGNPDDFIGKLQVLAGGIDEANEMASAARILLSQTAKKMNEANEAVLAARKSGGDAGEASIRFLNLIDRHAAIQDAVNGIRTATGRGLNLNKALVTDDLSEMSLSFLEGLGGAGKASERVIDLAAKLKAAKTAKARAELIRKARTEQSKTWGIANELFMGGILSGIPTQALNTGATGLNMFSRPVLRYAGAIGRGGAAVRKQAALEFAYSITSLADSLRLLHIQGGKVSLKSDFTDNPLAMAIKAGVRDRPVLDTQTKFGDADQMAKNSISADSWIAPARWMVNGVGHTVNIARRGLGATDEMFKQTVFRAQIKSRAMVDAQEMGAEALLAQGFKSKNDYVQHHLRSSVHTFENLSERYREMVKTGRALDDDVMRDEFIKTNLGGVNTSGKYTVDALTEARAVTFTSPLEPDAMMKGFENWANAQPALKQMAPFIRTPTNVLRENFERLPVVNLFMKHLKRDLKSPDPSVRAMARGKFIYGYSMATFAIYQAAQGRLTGPGPNWSDEPAEAKIWSESPNWQANSWAFPQDDGSTKFVDVSKLLPHFGAFTMTASIVEAYERHNEGFANNTPKEQAGILFGSALAAFASQVTMQSSFSGAGEVIEILNGDGGWQAAQRWVENRSVAMIPLSSFNYNANKEHDGIVRDTTDYLEKVKSRLPEVGLAMYGATRDAPFKHNWLTGQPLETPELLFWFLRTKVYSGNTMEVSVLDEVMKLDGGLNGPSKRIGQRKISPEIHQRLNQLSGTVTDKKGRTLVTALFDMINEPDYDKDALLIDYNVTPYRRNLLQSVVDGYKQLALAELVAQYPELDDEISGLLEIDAKLKAGVMPEQDAFDNRDARIELPQ
jgi:hypothetical protein